MKAPTIFRIAVLVFGISGFMIPGSKSVRAAGQAADAGSDPAQIPSVVKQYCVGCHNDRLRTSGLSLENVDFTQIPEHAELWERVITKLRTGAMPPAGVRRPPKVTIEMMATHLENVLDDAAAHNPSPGHIGLSRLNRTEYGNVVRDLLDLDIDVSDLLPGDDSSYGFDNIADVLKVSPSLLERYLAAARKVSRVAMGDTSISATSVTYKVPGDLTQDDHIEGLPFGTRGGTLIHHTFPLNGEYVIKVRLGRTIWGSVRGMAEKHQLDVRLDGKRVAQLSVGGIGLYGGQDERKFVVDGDPLPRGVDDLDSHLNVRLAVPAGPHDLVVTFPKEDFSEHEGAGSPAGSRDPKSKSAAGGRFTPDLRKPFIKSYVHYSETEGLPYVSRVFVEGPYSASGSGDTPSRRRILICHPTNRASEPTCATKIVSALVRRGYRGEYTSADVQHVLAFYNAERRRGGTFEAGIEMALRAMLVQPKFLFRIEHNPANASAGRVYNVSDLELASRLSFFIWSSAPDDELIELASHGRLSTPENLEQQVHRMLVDKRADALINDFAAQWLYLRNMNSVQPNDLLYPNFDDNLREAMRRETELFFGSIVHEDRSLLDLLTANYSYVNERLAQHYGIPNVYGSNFRRVVIEDPERHGLLGQGSILTVTSNATRTSPVLRGKWILDNILGTPPPPPPPDVPPLKEDGNAATMTMRERMAAHRSNPACSVCHSRMDPLGLSLEAFDAVGGPARDRGSKLDLSGAMPDGTKFDGPDGLREALISHGPQFVTTTTERLMTYALGRGVDYQDAPAIRRIVADAAAKNYSFSSIIVGIVNSVPFKMRVAVEVAANATTATVAQGPR